MTREIDISPGDVLEFTVELETVDEMADSDFLDRLADLVYEIDDLSDPMMGLNPDGSVHATFVIKAPTSLDAVQAGIEKFYQALIDAKPLRAPSESGFGPAGAVPTIGAVPVGQLVGA
jgi:hypothetical protein